MKTECILAISGTEVVGVSDVAEASTWFTTEPGVTEVVRMPVSAARLLYSQWPGRDAAMASLTPAQAPGKAAEREGLATGRKGFDHAYLSFASSVEGGTSQLALLAFEAAWNACLAALAPKPTGTEAGRGVGAETLESAPEDEAVILFTEGEWVGEARMLRNEDTGEQIWAWANGTPVHTNNRPLAWQHLPSFASLTIGREGIVALVRDDKVRAALLRLHLAIHALARREGNVTLFEASPSKSDASLAAWLELNFAQKDAASALAATPTPPTPDSTAQGDGTSQEGWRPISEAPKFGIIVVDGDGSDFVTETGFRKGPFLAHQKADEHSDNWPAWRISGVHPPKIIHPTRFYLVPSPVPADREGGR